MRTHRLAYSVLGLAAVVLWAMASCGAHGAAGEAALDFYGAPDTGPAPLEVHFHYFGDDAFIQTVTGWQWDFGDGASSADDFTTHEYASPGAYTVKLTVTLSGGGTKTVTKQECIKVTSGSAPETTEQPAEPAAEPAESPTEAPPAEAPVEGEGQDEGEDVVFIHHSCGENWLNGGLHDALVAKNYIDERNDITYGVDVEPDPGRPDTLGPVSGELTDMHHWILWFNDYLGSVQKHGCADGVNRILIFKSCFPNSHVEAGDSSAGDPFSDWKMLANYKAVYHHPGGSGQTYEHEGHAYHALEDVFAQHPDTLFITVTAPPECWAETDQQIAANARAFNNWLTKEWWPGYTKATGLHNVVVFDWFDLLAAPPNAGAHANQLRAEFGGNAGDSHPNDAANAQSTRVFASGPGNFIDRAWAEFTTKR
ncbi:MAG: PKD domain-containing protein [Candidatus Hydrogenedentes bacterium]|nr:PKD domain-containing protein [Candidatus Hydrogenedentota bacterium]